MSENFPYSGKRITLEEILRLKREERPSAEFWEEFDRDLRRRTLRVLVNEEPWHRRYFRPSIAQILAAFPIAAFTVVALVFIIYQNQGDRSLLADTQSPPRNLQKSLYVTGVDPVLRPGSQPTQQGISIAEASRLQVEFVMEVISIPRSNQLPFLKEMTPQTFAYFGTIPKSEPPDEKSRSKSSDVYFVSAPTLSFF